MFMCLKIAAMVMNLKISPTYISYSLHLVHYMNNFLLHSLLCLVTVSDLMLCPFTESDSPSTVCQHNTVFLSCLITKGYASHNIEHGWFNFHVNPFSQNVCLVWTWLNYRLQLNCRSFRAFLMLNDMDHVMIKTAITACEFNAIVIYPSICAFYVFM